MLCLSITSKYPNSVQNYSFYPSLYMTNIISAILNPYF